MRTRKPPLLVAIVSIPVLAALATPTAADPDAAATALSNAGEIVTQDNATPTSSSGGYTVETSNSTVTMPRQASGDITVDDKDSDSSDIRIALSGSSATAAESSPVGGIIYKDGDHSTTVLPKSDGSVQIATVIDSASSPSDYTYTFNGAEGSSFKMEDDGSVSLIGADGKWLGGIAAPWAKDANGKNVPTSYSIDGNKLTQHVSFDSTTAFPIVADPWWAGNLIDHTEWADLWEWSPTLMVYPTLWGRTAGIAFRAAAWQETLDETERNGHPNPNTSSMKNQFYCHWDAVRLWNPTKPSWNLDTKIPDRGLVGFLRNGCN